MPWEERIAVNPWRSEDGTAWVDGKGDGRVMLEVLGSIATIAATIVQAVSVVRLMKIEKELN